jgi:hypothetical protein
LAGETIAALAPAAVALCQFRGQQFCVPRLIDVRLARSRTKQIVTPPTTRAELAASNTVFGFTGRESGAFGSMHPVGSICAHSASLAAVVPENIVNAQRGYLTQETIANWMIADPPLAYFSRIEDGGAAARCPPRRTLSSASSSPYPGCGD